MRRMTFCSEFRHCGRGADLYVGNTCSLPHCSLLRGSLSALGDRMESTLSHSDMDAGCAPSHERGNSLPKKWRLSFAKSEDDLTKRGTRRVMCSDELSTATPRASNTTAPHHLHHRRSQSTPGYSRKETLFAILCIL